MKVIDFILKNIGKLDELVKVVQALFKGLDTFITELKGAKYEQE